MNERLNRRERAVNALFTLALLALLTYGSFENNNPAIEAALAQQEPTVTATDVFDPIPTLGPEYRVYNPLIAKNYKQPTPTATPVLPPPITEPPASPTLCPPDACETPTPTLEAPSNK